MRIITKFLGLMIVLFVLTLQTVQADVASGDVIDKSNYQKIEDLVPDYIVMWVKNGDMTMKIGKLNFDSSKFFPQAVFDHWEENIGKYKIDKDNGIVDTKTGKPARGIKGLPFSKPDINDPKMPVMLMYNNIFSEYFLSGNIRGNQIWLACTRGGLEKRLIMENYSLILDHSRSKQDYGQLSIFREPFGMSGVGTLALYALYPLTNGIRFAWAPELRKVRRMSHRLSGSDVHFGFDAAPDDTWAGGPKTSFEEATYKYLGEKEALIPYFSEDAQKVEWSKEGSVFMGNSGTGFEVKAGYETPGWKGAPWHITNVVWVKSKVYVIESDSIVPNYAYGPSEGWIEKGSFGHVYKKNVDPNGKLWKGSYWVSRAVETTDGKYRVIKGRQVCVDIRRDHGCIYPGPDRKGGFYEAMVKKMNPKLFTRAGFIKFSK